MTESSSLSVPTDLFVAYGPAPARQAWRWLWRLDERLVRLALEPSEPMLAQIRLAWWREQLSGEGKSSERRDPMLIELDRMAADRKLAIVDSALHLVDAVEAMAVNDNALPLEGARQRGEALTLGFARLTGENPEQAQIIGAYWGLAQLSPAVMSGLTSHWQDEVEQYRVKASGKGLPRALSLMRLHAGLLVKARGAPLGPAAGLKLIAHGLTGL